MAETSGNPPTPAPLPDRSPIADEASRRIHDSSQNLASALLALRILSEKFPHDPSIPKSVATELLRITELLERSTLELQDLSISLSRHP